MKKNLAGFVVFSLAFTACASAQESVRPVRDMATQEPQTSLSDELQRTRELLSIWKDHVRELTEERDEAVAELEKVRTGAGPAPAAPAGESASMSEEQITNLTRSVESLKAENATLQRNSLKLKAEIAKLQNGSAAPARPVEAAAPSEQLRTQTTELKSQVVRLTDENQKLKAENDSLRTQNEAVEADKQKASQSYMRLMTQNKEETASFKARIAEIESKAANAETLSQELEKARAAAAEAQTKLADIRRTGETQIADAKADAEVARQAYADLEASARRHDEETGERIRSLGEENERLKTENAAARDRLAEIQDEIMGLRPLEGAVDELKAEKAQLEKYVRELRAVQADQQKRIDELEVKLSTVNLDVEGFRASMNGSVDALARKYAPKK